MYNALSNFALLRNNPGPQNDPGTATEVSAALGTEPDIGVRRSRPTDMEADGTEVDKVNKAEHPRDKVRIVEHPRAEEKIKRHEIYIKELEERVSVQHIYTVQTLPVYSYLEMKRFLYRSRNSWKIWRERLH